MILLCYAILLWVEKSWRVEFVLVGVSGQPAGEAVGGLGQEGVSSWRGCSWRRWTRRRQSERVERSTYSHQPSDRARAASLPSPSPSPPPEKIIQNLFIHIFSHVWPCFRCVFAGIALSVFTSFKTHKHYLGPWSSFHLQWRFSTSLANNICSNIFHIHGSCHLWRLGANRQIDLTEELVEVALVSKEGDHDQNGKEEEGDDCFPQVNFVLQIVNS